MVSTHRIIKKTLDRTRRAERDDMYSMVDVEEMNGHITLDEVMREGNRRDQVVVIAALFIALGQKQKSDKRFTAFVTEVMTEENSSSSLDQNCRFFFVVCKKYISQVKSS